MGMFHLVSSRHFKSHYVCDYSVTTPCLYHPPPLQCSSSLMSLCLNQLKHLPLLLISFINCCIDPQGNCFANYQHNKRQLIQTPVPDFTHCASFAKAACSNITKRKKTKTLFWLHYKLCGDGDAKYMTATDRKKELFLQLKCEYSFVLHTYANE